MATKTLQSSELWTVARAQHWVVTRAQLEAAGLTRSAIRHRVAEGRLYSLWPSVYAVGRLEVGELGSWMAATLTCGPGAVLSGRDAMGLWEIRSKRSGTIEVTVPAAARPGSRRGIAIRRRALDPCDITTRHGIPVTTPVVTLIDQALVLSPPQLEAAINEADKLGLISPPELRRELDRYAGRPGAPALRTVLDRRTFRLTDSELERRFLPLARRAGLGPPQTQAWVNGFRVDFYWPDLGLVVETDGLTYHRTPAQQARDRQRDQAHAAAGLTSLRFTHAQVRYEPEHVERVLATVARRLRAAAA